MQVVILTCVHGHGADKGEGGTPDLRVRGPNTRLHVGQVGLDIDLHPELGYRVR